MEHTAPRNSYVSERFFSRLVPINSTFSGDPIHNAFGKLQPWIGIGAIGAHPSSARFIESDPEPEAIPPWLRAEGQSSWVCGRQSLP